VKITFIPSETTLKTNIKMFKQQFLIVAIFIGTIALCATEDNIDNPEDHDIVTERRWRRYHHGYRHHHRYHQERMLELDDLPDADDDDLQELEERLEEWTPEQRGWLKKLGNHVWKNRKAYMAAASMLG
uniref:hypothetical protein n=1 Tax=Salmonella sp. s51944 TaxID=3159655 RepID=UPI00397F15A2